MAIYGDQLVYYSEQFQSFECFKQVAKVGSGYDKVGESFPVTGVIQTGEGASTTSAMGRLSQYNGWHVLAAPEDKELWTYNKLDFGTYFYYHDEIWTVGKRKDWSLEAGFYAYHVGRMIGDNGEMTGTLPLKAGAY